MNNSDFLIERYYAKHEFSTKYMLSSSDAESWSIEELFALSGENTEILFERFKKLHLGYTESQGDSELRDIIASLYSANRNNVLLYTGAEEAIFSFVYAILEPQDHIIVMFPAYQSLYQVAENKGIEISLWECLETEGWKPPLDNLEELIKDSTKAIVINTPHNPTGFHFTHNDLDRIIEICRKSDLLLFSDEVYRYSEYNSQDRLSSVADLYENGISLGVMSKPMGLPGLRMGWIVTQNDNLYRKLQHFKDYVTICGSAPSEFIAKIAMKNFNAIIRRNRLITQSNLDLLRTFMTKYSEFFSWKEPSAGNIGFVRLLPDMNTDLFCDQVRDSQEVLLLPSSTYKYGSKHFRIGFGRKNFPEALERLEKFVQEKWLE